MISWSSLPQSFFNRAVRRARREEKRAKKHLRKIDDPAALVEVACHHWHLATRKLALSRLDDQELLFKVAQECDVHEVVRAAVGRLTAEWMIVELALGTSFDQRVPSAWWSALDRLQRPEDVAKVAWRSAVPQARRIAAERLRDPWELVEVARRSDDPFVLTEVAAKLPAAPASLDALARAWRSPETTDALRSRVAALLSDKSDESTDAVPDDVLREALDFVVRRDDKNQGRRQRACLRLYGAHRGTGCYCERCHAELTHDWEEDVVIDTHQVASSYVSGNEYGPYSTENVYGRRCRNCGAIG